MTLARQRIRRIRSARKAPEKGVRFIFPEKVSGLFFLLGIHIGQGVCQKNKPDTFSEPDTFSLTWLELPASGIRQGAGYS